MSLSTPEAVVLGSGPNGLAAAVTLARAGLRVSVLEGAATAGGGARSEALTLPGYLHDVCAAVHPLLAASPFFREHPLAGVQLLSNEVAVAHPLDGGEAVAVRRSLRDTAAELGSDSGAYVRLIGPLLDHARAIIDSALAPMLAVPAHPFAIARFGIRGLWPAAALARTFKGERARALLAGMAAHSMQPLQAPGTGAFGLLLAMLAHEVGWPVVQGGSARIVDALVAELHGLGGTLQTGQWIGDLSELPDARSALLDVTPQALLRLAGPRLDGRTSRALARFRHGPGVCKLDWALAGPVPWSAPVCRETATLHLGGTLAEISRGESQVAAGEHPQRPFCIAVQPCVLDPRRAPRGRQTFYAYCHVPAGSSFDMAERIEAQVERFAPGFRELILARHTTTAAELEQGNPNYVGGDINGGAATLRQTLLRPIASARPYDTALAGVYLCSSSTPPGGGVHGMCGVGAARAALRAL